MPAFAGMTIVDGRDKPGHDDVELSFPRKRESSTP
jgi:hypothetical protein